MTTTFLSDTHPFNIAMRDLVSRIWYECARERRALCAYHRYVPEGSIIQIYQYTFKGRQE